MQRQTLAGAGLVPKQAQNLPPREWARPGSWNRKWSLDTIWVKSGFQQLAKCPPLCMVFKESECGFQVPAPTHTSYLARWHSKTFQKARAGWAALTHRIGAHVPAPPRPSLAEGQPRGGVPTPAQVPRLRVCLRLPHPAGTSRPAPLSLTTAHSTSRVLSQRSRRSPGSPPQARGRLQLPGGSAAPRPPPASPAGTPAFGAARQTPGADGAGSGTAGGGRRRGGRRGGAGG